MYRERERERFDEADAGAFLTAGGYSANTGSRA